MANQLSKGALFNEHITNEVFNLVAGKSTLAKLSKKVPVPFNGKEVFTFTFDNEIDVIAENGKKTHGGMSLDPIKMAPVKVEYGSRISDEFMYASDEYKIKILKEFNEGFSKKLAKGLDLMAIHGINPRTGQASTVIGDNSLLAKATGNVISVTNLDTPMETLETAVGTVVANDREVTGMILSPQMATAIGKITTTGGARMYPEFMFGKAPNSFNGISIDVNSTVKTATNKNVAIVGDFENRFQWGYAKDVTTEIIEYGDPDNSGRDLKGYNQIYIRAEAYLGWAVIDPEAFATVKEQA